ncbi:hypothetical protein 7t3_0203 [Salmonella phage 7t3]|nr:hypothetical protein 7t3_0203 [Salmonella phage 7t3]
MTIICWWSIIYPLADKPLTHGVHRSIYWI